MRASWTQEKKECAREQRHKGKSGGLQAGSEEIESKQKNVLLSLVKININSVTSF